DDIETGGLVVKHLEVEGFEGEFLNNGEEPIGRWLSGEHALVFLELALPGLKGFAFLRRFRAGPLFRVWIVTPRNERSVGLLGWRLEPTIIFPSPLTPGSWWRASMLFCGAPGCSQLKEIVPHQPSRFVWVTLSWTRNRGRYCVPTNRFISRRSNSNSWRF